MKVLQFTGPVLAAGVCLSIWQAIGSFHGAVFDYIWYFLHLRPPIPSLTFFSSPLDVLSALQTEAKSGDLFHATLQTSGHTLFAAILAYALGVGLAEWLRIDGLVARSFRPIFKAFNGIPPVTLLPVFLVAFGLGAGSVVATATFGAFLSVLFIVLNGSSQLSFDFPAMISKMGYSPFGVWLWRLSSTSSYLKTAASEGLRWSLILVVVGEMHGAVAGGLGAYVDSGRLNQNYAVVYVGILACSMLSLALQRLLDIVGAGMHKIMLRLLLGKQM